MKDVLIIYEGAAGAPCDDLEGATPLEIARSVRASRLAARGMAGMLRWPTGDSAQRAENKLGLLLGLDPAEARLLRRGPVEAFGTAIDPSRWTYAYRGNFITTDRELIRENRVEGLSVDETGVLAAALLADGQPALTAIEVTAPGQLSVMFNHLEGKVDPGSFPEAGMETDDGSPATDRLVLMKKSAGLFAAHPVNDVRVDLGENPASMVWLWGGGAPTALGRPFIGAPLRAAMVSHSALARGMARLCGMKHVELGDPWSGDARPPLIDCDELAALIAEHDLTVIYVEAPHDGGHFGTAIEKVKSLDRLDIHVLGRVLDALDLVTEGRTMLVATPPDGHLLARTPFVCAGPQVEANRVTRWQESTDTAGAADDVDAHRCLTLFFGD